jgi:multiple sugar transport system substrate-binding protein
MLSWLLNLRKILFVLLAVGFIFISGCGANNPEAKLTKLTFWHGINPPSNRDIFQELVDKFNANHPDIFVEPLYIGQPDNQLPKILTAVVGNVPPDILWFTPQITGQLAQLGAIKPLDEWWNGSPLKSEIDPALTGSMTWNDRIWSVPLATNNTAIFYRPSLFEKAGITELPKTWDELYEAAEMLTQDTNNDGRIDQHGIYLALGKGEFTVFVWLPFVFSAEGQLLTANNQPDLLNPGTVEALEFAGKLVENDLAILSPPESGYILDSFIAGEAAMQVTGPWTLGQLGQLDIDYDVFPIPVRDQKAAVVGGESLFVFKSDSKHEIAAYEFLEYVLSEQFQTQWALGTGYLPINLKAQESETYQNFVQDNPVLKVFLQQMKWAKSRPVIPEYSRLSENFGRAIEATLLGESPQSALAESQERLELVFDNKD